MTPQKTIPHFLPPLQNTLRTLAIAIPFLLIFCQIPSSSFGEERSGREFSRPGLLILTHGSPAASWNVAVEALLEKVREENQKDTTFHAIEMANLEFCEPDAQTGIQRLEAAGCDRIIVVPAFIFPTSHSHFDVPAVLGLYSSPALRHILREENAVIANPRVPVTLTQTLWEGDLLQHYLFDEITKLSTDPENEVLLLIAHGDEGHTGLIEPVMWELVTQSCGKFGLFEGNCAYCEVGQSYRENVLPLIGHYEEMGKTVLVVGLYLATPAQKLHERAVSSIQTATNEATFSNHAQSETATNEAVSKTMSSNEAASASQISEEDRLNHTSQFSTTGLIEHPETPAFLLKISKEALYTESN